VAPASILVSVFAPGTLLCSDVASSGFFPASDFTLSLTKDLFSGPVVS
jgi:hypothetical protein